MLLVPPVIEQAKAGDVGHWSPLIYAVLTLVVAGLSRADELRTAFPAAEE